MIPLISPWNFGEGDTWVLLGVKGLNWCGVSGGYFYPPRKYLIQIQIIWNLVCSVCIGKGSCLEEGVSLFWTQVWSHHSRKAPSGWNSWECVKFPIINNLQPARKAIGFLFLRAGFDWRWLVHIVCLRRRSFVSWRYLRRSGEQQNIRIFWQSIDAVSFFLPVWKVSKNSFFLLTCYMPCLIFFLCVWNYIAYNFIIDLWNIIHV